VSLTQHVCTNLIFHERIAPFLVGAALLNMPGFAAEAADQGSALKSLWGFYNAALRDAKYIDLTHAIAPGGPIGEGFTDFKVGPTLAGVAIPGVINKGEPFTYRHGPVPSGSMVMIRSDWSKKWNDPKRFTTQPFPGVTLAALKYLHQDRHILMHGHEPLDTDNTAPEFVGEKWLLRHNFAQAEGVANLDQVPESGAVIAIGFAKFEGGTGGFARYIAIAPASWPHGMTIEQQSGAPLPTHLHALARGADGVLRDAP
jgi:kynurenine formamidase